MYNRLFTKILDSSIWLEPQSTRVVWITLLAAMDEDGIAHFAAIGNLARRANVSEEEAEAAVKCFLSPDPNSSDPDYEGRRIERIPGGFVVLNAPKYKALFNREMQLERTRMRVAKHRATSGDVTPCNGVKRFGNASVTQSETETETETEAEGSSGIGKPNERKSSSTLCRAEARPQSAFGGVLIAETPADSTPTVKTPRKAISDAARAILDFLNNAASRAFEPVEANLRPIQHRLTEVDGDVDGIKEMITRQCALWKTDDKMAAYLRPATLFNRTKFHSYYADRNLPVRNGHARSQGAGADRNARIGGGHAWEAQAAARIARMEAHCPWDPREPSPESQTGG